MDLWLVELKVEQKVLLMVVWKVVLWVTKKVYQLVW